MPIVITGLDDARDQMVSVFRGALPGDLAGLTEGTGDEAAIGCAEAMAWADGVTQAYVRESRIGTSQGRFLDEHASEQLVSRADGEDDSTLRERLRRGQRAIIAADIEAIVDDVLIGAGGAAGQAFYQRLPRDGAVSAAAGAVPTSPSTANRCRSSIGQFRARLGPEGRRRILIVMIPAGLGAVAAVEAALADVQIATHSLIVEEYTTP